jgi:PhoPQ-activated pathogenicity-related protein
MRFWLRTGFLLTALLLFGNVLAEEPSVDALARYVAAPDASHEWREIGAGRIGAVEYTELILTSQTWRGRVWKHQLILLRPPKIDPGSSQAFLFVHGGRWKPEYEQGYAGKLPRAAPMFARLAELNRAPLGVLLQVPHQPLFERTEDALIAYTFDRYLDTGEADWPLLLPMVKSVARGMDVMQEFASQRWDRRIDSFTIAGASKRGWTSWLTAAVDPRVASVAPIVIDMLNLPAQIKLQQETFSGMSEQVADYTAISLPDRLNSDRGRNLLAMVDPYSYRSRLTQSKLIVLGTNDRYWPLNALNVYWNDLPEPKHLLYIPNQGHGLTEMKKLMASLSAFHRYTASAKPLPKLTWNFNPAERSVAVTVQADRKPSDVRIWHANSPTKDFREATWRSQRCRRESDHHRCTNSIAPSGYTAVFAEVSFRDPGDPQYSLSTTVCITSRSRVMTECQ